MRAFWKRREREVLKERLGIRGPLADLAEVPTTRPLVETIEIERGASRAASISRVAEELRRRDEEVVELFKMVASPVGQATMPIHLRRGGEDAFVEVETGPWERKTVRDILKTAAVLRSSEYSGATFEVLSAYPLPEEVRYFCGRSPAALLQLDLVCYADPAKAEACGKAFRNAVRRRWGLDLDYDPEELPLVEELLLAVLGEEIGSGSSSGS